MVKNIYEVIFHVPGIKCNSCANKIQDNLKKLLEITNIHISVISCEVKVVVDTSITDVNKIKDVLHSIGFDNTLVSILPINAYENFFNSSTSTSLVDRTKACIETSQYSSVTDSDRFLSTNFTSLDEFETITVGTGGFRNINIIGTYSLNENIKNQCFSYDLFLNELKMIEGMKVLVIEKPTKLCSSIKFLVTIDLIQMNLGRASEILNDLSVKHFIKLKYLDDEDLILSRNSASYSRLIRKLYIGLTLLITSLLFDQFYVELKKHNDSLSKVVLHKFPNFVFDFEIIKIMSVCIVSLIAFISNFLILKICGSNLFNMAIIDMKLKNISLSLILAVNSIICFLASFIYLILSLIKEIISYITDPSTIIHSAYKTGDLTSHLVLSNDSQKHHTFQVFTQKLLDVNFDKPIHYLHVSSILIILNLISECMVRFVQNKILTDFYANKDPVQDEFICVLAKNETECKLSEEIYPNVHSDVHNFVFEEMNIYFDQIEKQKVLDGVLMLEKNFDRMNYYLMNRQFLSKGDIIILHSGDFVPADCIILSTNDDTFVDNSIITGEKMKIEVKIYDSIIHGSYIYSSKPCLAIVKLIKPHTQFEQIQEYLKKSLNSSSLIDYKYRLDRYSKTFVSIVLLTSFVTWFVWSILVFTNRAKINGNLVEKIMFIFEFGLTVINMMCPCSFTLAYPLAVSRSIMIARKKNILINNPKCLFKIKNIDTIVFDKTGTLCMDEIELVDVQINKDNIKKLIDPENCPIETFYTILYASEKIVNHPIAKAINKKARLLAKKRSWYLINLEKKIAHGIIATLGHQEKKIKIYIGNCKFLKLIDIQNQYELNSDSNLIYVFDSRANLFGSLCYKQKLEQKLYNFFETLKSKNLWVCSGDSKQATAEIASTLSIKNYLYSVSPWQKAKFISSLIKQSKNVMMVGDGINDALAIQRANVGVSVGIDCHISNYCSDFVLLSNDVTLINDLFKIAKKASFCVKLNFSLSIVFNLITLPVSTGFFYPNIVVQPTLGCLIMLINSLAMIINTLIILNDRKFSVYNFRLYYWQSIKNLLISVGYKFNSNYS